MTVYLHGIHKHSLKSHQNCEPVVHEAEVITPAKTILSPRTSARIAEHPLKAWAPENSRSSPSGESVICRPEIPTECCHSSGSLCLKPGCKQTFGCIFFSIKLCESFFDSIPFYVIHVEICESWNRLWSWLLKVGKQWYDAIFQHVTYPFISFHFQIGHS